MRVMASVALAMMLSGCGGDHDDFTVQVKRSPDAVLSSLAKIDVTGPTELVPKPIKRTLSDGGIIEYLMPAAGGYDDGVVRFTVSANKKGGARIAVMIDVPAVKGTVDGSQMVLAEDRVEKVLKKDLQSLAENLESGSDGGFATLQLEGSLVGVAAVIQSISNGGLIPQGSAADGATLLASGPSEGDWGPAQQEFVPRETPMSDPDDDVSSYGEPMADDSGYDDSGFGDDDGWGG